MSAFSSGVLCAALAVCLFGVGCSSSGGTQQHEIGEAFAGPATLNLRREIDPKSDTITTVKHGDRLGIIRRRRRFVMVRTDRGVEGWTDLRQLLSSDQMDALNQLAENARSLPSQGAAGVYEPLNVHTEANRTAPSFYRINKGEAVDLVAQELSPRIPFDPPDLIPKPPPPKPKARKPKAEPRVPPVPIPPPPKVPDNWLELSKTIEPEPETPPPPPEPPKPVPVDDWSLVRLKNGRAGWVLTGMLRMNIPDEVAQYSEGNRITSYFSMADVNDEGQVRHHWLWTTLSTTRQPYQFDSFRYFIWNMRRHRYETAYIQKNVKGYFPIEVHPVKATLAKKEEAFPGFSLILEDENGARWRKTYAYQIYRVVLVDAQKLAPPPPAPAGTPQALTFAQPAQQQSPSLFTRMKERLAAWKRRIFGK